MRLPEAVVAERDARAFELRKGGMSYRAIARALDISESTAHAAVQRVMERIGKRLAEDHSDMVILEMERLDQLMQNIWPMTMPHKVQNADGEEIKLPPSLDAVDRVIKIMDRRAKILGLDSVSINVGTNQDGPSLGGTKNAGEITPQEEAMRLAKVFLDSGVIDKKAILAAIGTGAEDIVDAELVEDHSPAELSPPEYFEDEDEEDDDSRGWALDE